MAQSKQTIHARNGVEMDVSPEIARRMLDYRNGDERLVSNRRFEFADPINRREAPGGTADIGDAVDADPEIVAATRRDMRDEAADAREAREVARLQASQIRRVQSSRGAPTSPRYHKPGSDISDIVADALGSDDAAGNIDMPARTV